MKLIIQIPCLNEESTLPITLATLPRAVKGFDKVEWLIIDDGSTDQTRQVAQDHGVDHIVRFGWNQGLARAFSAGLEKSLCEGADVIVNIDADNQYNADDIPKLTQPILDQKAEYVVGERPIGDIEHFPASKKLLQKLGSHVVRKISGVSVVDAPSGFRAMSRGCATKINVFSSYTYTLETLIQAGQSNIAVISVPIRVNSDLRPSRLVRGPLSYVGKSVTTIFRIFVVYQPFKFFFVIGAALFSLGVILGIRFLYFFLTGDGSGHIQSVVLSGVFVAIGFQTILVAFLADLISVNRRLLEELVNRGREIDVSGS